MQRTSLSRSAQRLVAAALALAGTLACGRVDVDAAKTSADALTPDARASAARAGTLAGEHYYMLVFGAQDLLDEPRASHTFATFVASPSIAGETAQLDAVDTISWMPQDLQIALFQHPEPGVNLSLAASLELARTTPMNVRRSTTLEITPALYARAMARVAFFENAERDGSTLYTVLDGSSRDPAVTNQPGGAINCIHAVSDLGGWLQTGGKRGFAASRTVLANLLPETIAPGIDHTWVAAALGVGPGATPF